MRLVLSPISLLFALFADASVPAHSTHHRDQGESGNALAPGSVSGPPFLKDKTIVLKKSNRNEVRSLSSNIALPIPGSGEKNKITRFSSANFRLLSQTFGGYTWDQFGVDINAGEGAGENAGYSVAISSDGYTVAVGIPNKAVNGNAFIGQVYIYRWNGVDWNQRGNAINGSVSSITGVGGKFGSSVSISADGNMVAIGSPDFSTSTMGGVGFVKVFSWDDLGSEWLKLGEDIYGKQPSDAAGAAISLSADGLTVAIGAPSYSNGRVYIYRWSGSSWTQLGSDIFGGSFYGSGRSLSISDDGNRVVIGSPGSMAGAGNKVRVYEWNGSQWSQLGSEFGGRSTSEKFGASVSLSGDGSTIAIGAPYYSSYSGYARIYAWDASGASWNQLGSDIIGDTPSYSGSSVSLSTDGTIVAIGAYTASSTETAVAGQVRIFQWDVVKNWTKIGDDIYGVYPEEKSGYSVSLSSNGKMVAIGAPFSDANGTDSGIVRVFELASAPGPKDDIKAVCSIDDSSLNLTCTGSIEAATIPGGTLKTTLVDGVCAAGTPAILDGSNKTVSLAVDLACKNDVGGCSFDHCFRVDYVVSGISVIAKMFNIISSVVFDKSGSFSVQVETASFASANATTTANSSVTIDASYGACGTSSSGSVTLDVGETAAICVFSASNVTLTLKDVTVSPGGQTLIDSNGGVNFITQVTGEDTNQVTLETLMIPAYYDAQNGAGGQVTISGTAEITYTSRRRLLAASASLEEKEYAPFALKVPLLLRNDEMDQMTEEFKQNVGSDSVMGSSAFVVVLIAGAFIFF